MSKEPKEMLLRAIEKAVDEYVHGVLERRVDALPVEALMDSLRGMNWYQDFDLGKMVYGGCTIKIPMKMTYRKWCARMVMSRIYWHLVCALHTHSLISDAAKFLCFAWHELSYDCQSIYLTGFVLGPESERRERFTLTPCKRGGSDEWALQAPDAWPGHKRGDAHYIASLVVDRLETALCASWPAQYSRQYMDVVYVNAGQPLNVENKRIKS